jgi:hypothetical protein
MTTATTTPFLHVRSWVIRAAAAEAANVLSIAVPVGTASASTRGRAAPPGTPALPTRIAPATSARHCPAPVVNSPFRVAHDRRALCPAHKQRPLR